MPAKINVTSHISSDTWSRTTVAQSSSKILAVGKLHWPSGWQQKHLWSKHPL